MTFMSNLLIFCLIIMFLAGLYISFQMIINGICELIDRYMKKGDKDE